MANLKINHQYVLDGRRAIYLKIIPDNQINTPILTFLMQGREDNQDVVYLKSYHENQFASLKGRTLRFRGEPVRIVRLPNRGTQSESSVMCRGLLSKVKEIKALSEETA